MTTATAPTTDLSALTGTYTLDPAHTRMGFVARHAMITKVRGAFNEVDGVVRVDGDHPARSSVRLTIQASSIDTRNGQRDAHLRSTDFLDVDRYPQLSFLSTMIEQVAADRFLVTGDLTIRGTTRPVTIDLLHTGAGVDEEGAFRIGFEGSSTINRSDWGVTWNAALETGGVLVGDRVQLEFEVSAIRMQ